jgi:sec-independent protein translocase protein TatC
MLDDTKMPLTAHLEELRWRILWALAAIVVAFCFTYGFANEIFNLLTAPLLSSLGDRVELIGTGVTEAFFTKLKVGLIAALFAASPVVFYQLWMFIAPGLYEREKKYARPFVVSATFFFVLGAVFCYAAVFPVAFQFFIDEFASINVAPSLRITEYLSFSSQMLLAFGVIFELPVLTFFFARIGVVTHHLMIASGRYAIVVIFVVAAILTPPDAMSQMLMAVPLLALYAISIGVAYFAAPPPKQGEGEDPADAP